MGLKEYYSNAYDSHHYPNPIEEMMDSQSPVEKAFEANKLNIRPDIKDFVEPPITLENVGKSAYGVAKGIPQGEAGIVNLVETVFNGLKNVVANPDNKSLIDSFVQGYEQGTITPTSKEFKAILEQFIPPPAKGYEDAEFMGELLSPGVSIGLPAKAIAKGVQATTKAVTKKAK